MYTPKGEIDDRLYELIKNEEVVEKLSHVTSANEAYEVVKNAGVDISFEDFKNNMKIAKDLLEEKEEGILTDEDLDQVAGGGKEDNVIKGLNVTIKILSFGLI